MADGCNLELQHGDRAKTKALGIQLSKTKTPLLLLLFLLRLTRSPFLFPMGDCLSLTSRWQLYSVPEREDRRARLESLTKELLGALPKVSCAPIISPLPVEEGTGRPMVCAHLVRTIGNRKTKPERETKKVVKCTGPKRSHESKSSPLGPSERLDLDSTLSMYMSRTQAAALSQ